MDISDSLAPKSDQLDAVDLLGGPRTFTVESVARNNSPEQPINVRLAEFPRVWRPAKSMRRILAAAWGTDASQYAGRRVTLYCDPDVRFGKDRVGGTRISHLSHIDKPLSVPLLVTRGKSQVFTVQPLPDAPAGITDEDVEAAQTTGDLKVLWDRANRKQQQRIRERVAELNNPQPAAEPAEHDPTLDADFGGAA